MHQHLGADLVRLQRLQGRLRAGVGAVRRQRRRRGRRREHGRGRRGGAHPLRLGGRLRVLVRRHGGVAVVGLGARRRPAVARVQSVWRDGGGWWRGGGQRRQRQPVDGGGGRRLQLELGRLLVLLLQGQRHRLSVPAGRPVPVAEHGQRQRDERGDDAAGHRAHRRTGGRQDPVVTQTCRYTDTHTVERSSFVLFLLFQPISFLFCMLADLHTERLILFFSLHPIQYFYDSLGFVCL